jgi:hypothetical protein
MGSGPQAEQLQLTTQVNEMTTTFIGAWADAGEKLLEIADTAESGLPGAFAARMYTTVSNVPNMIRGIAGMIESPDPTIPEQGNFLKVTEKVEEAERFTTAAINRQNVILAEWEADLARRENATCGFDRGSPDAERILNKFCSKDAGAQLQDMAEWLKDPKQGYKLGIVAKADPYVTNLTPDMAERFKRDFVKLHAPALAHEREARGKIHEALIGVAGLTSRVKGTLSDPRRYAEIRDRKAMHSAAERDFLAAITGNAE